MKALLFTFIFTVMFIPDAGRAPGWSRVFAASREDGQL